MVCLPESAECFPGCHNGHMAPNSPDAAEVTNPDRLTVSIYQNPEYVSGILQQASSQPLVVEEVRERVARMAAGDGNGNTEEPSMRSSQSYKYSQALYLYAVKDKLRSRDELHYVSDSVQSRKLRAGDFVEFTAGFRANQVNALLDILTPDLVAEVVAFNVRRSSLAIFDGYPTFEEIQRSSAESMVKSEVYSSLARAIAQAIRVDFRSESTREFYGTIGRGAQAATAVTICDTAHFVTEDKDRILDGEFTVLGKVTSASRRNVPLLERNKLLERIRPDAVDKLFGQLTGREVPAETDLFDTIDDIVDLGLSSRIPGWSFKVIPIAIYA